MPTDEELVGRLAEGDETALQELLRRYERRLGAFLWRHTGGIDVEDLYQETWLRVVRNAARFDLRKRFSTWLFQISLNLCRDWHRRQRRASTEPVPETGQENGVEAKLDAEALLALLPQEQREVVMLRYYNDLTEAETASILDCARGTVKSRLHSALARLAEVVGREEKV
jgi:RNA polymerase sigma-70 factor (ECF subfamily)